MWNIGQRVALHPATDWWMRGARYGNVVKLGRKLVWVRLDHGRVIKFTLGTNLIEPV